jgi:hypothetical protein
MQELFPIASGLGVGMLLGAVRPSLRLRVATVLAVVLGTAATVISGEYRIGWEFLLIDIPLVALCAAAAFAAGRWARQALGGASS